MTTDHFRIIYAFRFEDGSTIKFDIFLDTHSLALVNERRESLPDWTLLAYHQCRICPLDAVSHPRCPVAANFAGIAEKFRKFTSHERVTVTCIVEERTYSKTTTIQMGLSPLLGIIMTTSGCPIMEQLKPMVRFHLPFASLDETIFRMVSMYLVAQYLRHQIGKPVEWGLDGLRKIYAQVEQVNADFIDRLAGAAQNDVNVNALVNLDAFAKMVPLAVDKLLQEITPYFSALLK